MQITLRIYRTHDYDLMALHRCGALNFPKAARKALIAYYKKESLLLSTDTTGREVPGDLPAMMEFNINIGERIAPGFNEWFRTVKRGYRNNLVKNILRASLDGLCTELYMPEGRRFVDAPDSRQPVSMAIQEPKHPKAPKELKGGEWVEAVANEKPARNLEVKISDIETLLAKKRSDSQSGKKNPGSDIQGDSPSLIQESKMHPDKTEHRTENTVSEQQDDDFDAFDSFENLMRRR